MIRLLHASHIRFGTKATDWAKLTYGHGDRPTPTTEALSFDEFLAHYGGDNRYELIDGEVFDLEPTGLHEEVSAFITTKICVQIDKTGLPYSALQRGLLRLSNMGMTAFRPDVAVIDRDELTKELL